MARRRLLLRVGGLLVASCAAAALLQGALCWWLALRQSLPVPYRTDSFGEWRVVHQRGWGHRGVNVVRDGQLFDAITRAVEEGLVKAASTPTSATTTRTYSKITIPLPGLEKFLTDVPKPPVQEELPPKLPKWAPPARFPDAPTREAHAFGWPALALRYSAELDPRRATEATFSSLRVRTPGSFAARALEGCVPVGVLWRGFILDAGLLGTAMAAPVLCIPAIRRTYRRASGRCPACGYDLKDAPTPSCPECGK